MIRPELEPYAQLPNVPAIAQVIREGFPELEQRCFAIMEATLTKENMPNLPLAFVAMMNVTGENQSNDMETPIDFLERFCVEFWLKPSFYKKADGSQSPFYAYQDYQSYLLRLISILRGYLTPIGKSARFIALTTQSDEFAVTLNFVFSIKWRMRIESDHKTHPIRFKFAFNPNVPPIPGGEDYSIVDDCGRTVYPFRRP